MVDRILRVDLNGEHVGDLTKTAGGVLHFSYSSEWLSHPNRRSISISLPLSEREFSGIPVVNFFSNLLPDNSETVRRIIRLFRLPSEEVFDILAAVGRDCIGALQFYPPDFPAPDPYAMKSRILTEEEIEGMLLSHRDRPLGMTETEDFRISITGAQTKTGLLYLEGQWRLPLAAAPTSHILKLPIGSMNENTIDFSDSCENEWLCLKVARAFGLPAAEAELVRFGTVRAIAVKRFDRMPSARRPGVLLRLPAEDMCQALGIPAHRKYESDGGPGIIGIMSFLNGSAQRRRDRHVFMSAQVLMWLLDATDAHAKNYSIFLRQGDRFELAPLYDLLSAAPLTASGELSERKLKLAMALIGKNRHDRMADVQPRHFLSTAEAVNFSADEMIAILRHFAEKAPEAVEELRKQLPADFPESTARPIFRTILRRSAMLSRFLDLSDKTVS